MPQIICRGLLEEEVCALSENLGGKLAEIVQVEPDWFVFEYINSKSFSMGKPLDKEVIIDLMWFDRGEEIKQKVQNEITDSIKRLNYNLITVIFHNLEKNSYFENGEHF